MTERLYYTCDETEARAQVVHCLTEADGRYAIELNQTLFHPQGGGQPADRGWIGGIAVEGVVTRGDRVMHIIAQPLPPGEVAIRVDEAAWRLHSRLHSAGHLIGLAGERAGWRPVKAYDWPGERRITFTAIASAIVPEASALLATTSLPPWLSTMVRVTDRPSPIPPDLVVVIGWNIRST